MTDKGAGPQFWKSLEKQLTLKVTDYFGAYNTSKMAETFSTPSSHIQNLHFCKKKTTSPAEQWSQRANDRYNDHLDGQLTTSTPLPP